MEIRDLRAAHPQGPLRPRPGGREVGDSGGQWGRKEGGCKGTERVGKSTGNHLKSVNNNSWQMAAFKRVFIHRHYSHLLFISYHPAEKYDIWISLGGCYHLQPNRLRE